MSSGKRGSGWWFRAFKGRGFMGLGGVRGSGLRISGLGQGAGFKLSETPPLPVDSTLNHMA